MKTKKTSKQQNSSNIKFWRVNTRRKAQHRKTPVIELSRLGKEQYRRKRNDQRGGELTKLKILVDVNRLNQQIAKRGMEYGSMECWRSIGVSSHGATFVDNKRQEIHD